MGQYKHCGSGVKEGMRFCGNCGASQEAEAVEMGVMAEESGEVAEKSVVTVAGKNAAMGTEESTAAGQEVHGEDRSPALAVTVEGATEETAAITAGENAVTGTEESTTAGQEASDEVMYPAVPRPSAEASGEPVTTTAEGDSVLSVSAAEAVGEPVATTAGENAMTGIEKTAAVGQEVPGETAKRKPHRLRAALFVTATVAVAAVGTTVLLHRMATMTGERFARAQAEALRQKAVSFEGLSTVFENGFSSDFMLNMQMSCSGLLALSRGGNENYMLVAKALQRGIQAEVDLGRHLEVAVLNLESGADDSAKLNFDCFLDSEKFGYRILQVGEQAFVLNYPEVFRQYSGGACFSTAELAALVSLKALLSASAARYGCALVVAFKPRGIKAKKRVYTSYALKYQLDHETKGEYTAYTWNPDRETLETLFRSLAAEMREDKGFTDWYNRRQEAGEELVTALGMGWGKAAHFSDVADYAEKYAADWVETLEQRNLHWKLVMQGKEVAAICVVDNGERPFFYCERDQAGDTLHHGVGDEVFLGTSAEERSRKENSYGGRVTGRLAMFGNAWLWSFRLCYSKMSLDGEPSVLRLPNGSHRYTYFDADRPDREYTSEVKEKQGRSAYELDDGYDKFTLTAIWKGSTRKSTGREVGISDKLSGSGKSLPQEKFSDITEKL